MPKISLFEPKKTLTKRIAILKRRGSRRINYSQIDLATDSKKNPICAKNVPKVKQKDSEYKNSSLVSQIDCQHTEEKSKLLVKCFVNSFGKNIPISARNVQRLPGMSLFEPRKKSKKRILVSKLALQ